MAGQYCAISIGGNDVAALVLKSSKKGWSVAAAAAAPLEAEDAASLSMVLKGMMKSLKAAKLPVVLSLPKQQAILRNVTLPSTQPAELAQMARFEAERHIPFHAERHSTAFHLMRSMGVEGSEVLLCAVDGPVVQRGLDALDAAGLNPAGVTLSSISLVNALLFAKGDWIKDKTLAALSIGLDTLNLVLMTQGRVIYARSSALDLRGLLEGQLGHQAGDPAAPRADMAKLAMCARMIDCRQIPDEPGGRTRPLLDKIVQEVKRTYDYARREMKCPPIEALAITGEGAALRNADAFFAEVLDVPVQTINPAADLPGAAGLQLPFDGLAMTLALGAAVSAEMPGAYKIDLTPQEHYRRLQHGRFKRQMIGTGVLLAIALMLGGAAWWVRRANNQRLMAAYREINEKMQPEVAELHEMEIKLRIITRFLEDPHSALAVLEGVAASPAVPGKVSIDAVRYEKEKSVGIDGSALTIQDINNFIADLRGTEHFAYINPTQSPSQLYQNPIYTFKLDCGLNTGENGKDKAGEEKP